MWLVKKAQRGDADAFVELMEQHKQSLYKVARSYLQSEDDIADVLSETTLSAYEHIGELRNAVYFKTWITRIAINHCKNLLRSQKKCIAVEQVWEDTQIGGVSTNMEFMELVGELPEEYRMIFVLYYGEGFKTREIADALEISENTVKSRLRRGRVKLKSAISQ